MPALTKSAILHYTWDGQYAGLTCVHAHDVQDDNRLGPERGRHGEGRADQHRHDHAAHEHPPVDPKVVGHEGKQRRAQRARKRLQRADDPDLVGRQATLLQVHRQDGADARKREEGGKVRDLVVVGEGG